LKSAFCQKESLKKPSILGVPSADFAAISLDRKYEALSANGSYEKPSMENSSKRARTLRLFELIKRKLKNVQIVRAKTMFLKSV
jgi:hypothetical protein